MDEILGNTIETKDNNHDNSRDIGAKILSMVPDEKIPAPEPVDSKLDPFWGEHPKLLEEAQQLGAPLTVREFKEQGYGFEKDTSGKLHILAPTRQYSDWLKSDNTTPFVGIKQESIKDQESRLQKEKIQAYLENRKEKLGLNNPENIKNKPWDDLIKDREAIGFIYDTLYPGGIEHGNKEVIIKKVVESLERSFPSEDRMIYKINKSMAKAYKNAFAIERTSLPSDEMELVHKMVLENEYDPSYYYKKYDGMLKKQGGKIMDTVAKLQIKENTPQLLEKIEENLQKVKEDGAYLALQDRRFFPETLKENPDSINAIFEDLGIDKNSDTITIGVLLGYGIGYKPVDDSDPEIKVFDLKNRMATLFEHDVKSEHHDLRNRNNNLEIFDEKYKPDYEKRWRPINHEISKEVMDRIKTAEHDLIDRIKGDPELEKVALERGKRDILTEISLANTENQKFNFDKYLDTETLNINAFDQYVSDFIKSSINDEELEYFINDDNIYNALNTFRIEIGDGYKNIIRDELLRRLSQGSVKEYWYSRGERYSAEIFETEDFKKNQERLGIDFEDPEIIELAFNGFINTLCMRNGEKSEQADWYYDNIFANDPGKFLEKIKAFREQSDDRGTKAKITRFFKNNPQALEDKARVEIDRRFHEEINNEKRAVKTSILRDAKRGDINKIVNEYKSKLVSTVREKGAEEVATFIGERQTYKKQGEGGEKSYKETPFDFGLEKGDALIKYGDFVEKTFPDCNIHWFTDTFPRNGEDSEIFDDQSSYLGFSFEYHGKLCVIAESLNNEAAMYLWRGEIGEDLNNDFRQMFDMARFDAKRSDDPRIVSVGHLDKEHFDDSLDTTYQKAFMFFNSGDKAEVLYKNYGGQEGWGKHRDEVLGAWPLNVEQDYENYPDLDKYHAWQKRQSEIEDRLSSAMKQGGQEAVKKELEKIAEEDYSRMYQE